MRKNRFGLSVALATPFTDVAPDLMQPLLDGIEEPRVNAMVEQVLPYAVTAAVKALVGLRRNDPLAWRRMRAPLASLDEADVRKLGRCHRCHPQQARGLASCWC